MDLRSALLGCSSGQLSRIAAAWELSVEAGTLRRELVESLAERILERVEDDATWARLGERARGALGVLVRAGGRQEVDLLTRRVVRLSRRDDDDAFARAVEATLGDLVERGLVFRVFDAEEQRRGVYLVVADEVLTAARQHLDQDPRDDVDSAPQAGAAAPERVARIDLASDLFVLASALRREAWGRASRGLAGRRALSAGGIVARLRSLPADGPGDPGRRWRFLLWVAQRAGWISRDSQPVPDDDTLERLLSDPASLPGSALAAGPVPAATPVPSGRGPERDGPRRRQADALQLLSELGDEGWWTATELTRWLSGHVAGDEMADRGARNDQVAGQIERWLAGRWFWLGLVAWGRDGSAWTLVSPTSALRGVAGVGPTGSVRAPAPCAVEPGLKLVAPPTAELAALYPAERYLVFGGTEDGARRYTLTPASFDRGLRLGGDPEVLLGLVERLTQTPLPDTWRVAVDRWASGARRLHLGARLLLTGDREETLRDALSTASAREAVVEKVSARHAVVAGEHIAALLADLAQAGLPVEIEPGLRAEPADSGRSAALAGGVAETAWVALEVLRRIAPEVVS